MLTLFSIPKPFLGAVGVIQRNAIRSWTALRADVEVVLLGDEEGIEEAAAELGARHVGEIARSERGTPRLDDAFAQVDAVATQSLRCFVNCDVLLLDDFLPAVARTSAFGDRFLMVGRTHDLDVTDELDVADPGIARDLRRRGIESGRSRGATAIDYFVFPPGLFDPIPPFVVGRARFDNWLVWRARRRGPVVDATPAVMAIHQAHDYAHIPGGFAEAHFGEEALANERLTGGKQRVYTINDASHVLRADGSIGRNLGSLLRARENARKLAWKLGRR